MIGKLFGLGQGLGAIGPLTQSPLAKAAVRYWWVTVPLGYVAWRAYQRRKTKGEVDLDHLINDLAPAATLVMSLVMLDLTLRGQTAGPLNGLPAAPRTVDVEAEVVAPAEPVAQPAPQGASHEFV